MIVGYMKHLGEVRNLMVGGKENVPDFKRLAWEIIDLIDSYGALTRDDTTQSDICIRDAREALERFLERNFSIPHTSELPTNLIGLLRILIFELKLLNDYLGKENKRRLRKR